MAIKPKSRAHEDRIKALEQASKDDAALGHEADERIRALENRCEHLESGVLQLKNAQFHLGQAIECQQPPVPWYKRIFGL